MKQQVNKHPPTKEGDPRSRVERVVTGRQGSDVETRPCLLTRYHALAVRAHNHSKRVVLRRSKVREVCVCGILRDSLRSQKRPNISKILDKYPYFDGLFRTEV